MKLPLALFCTAVSVSAASQAAEECTLEQRIGVLKTMSHHAFRSCASARKGLTVKQACHDIPDCRTSYEYLKIALPVACEYPQDTIDPRDYLKRQIRLCESGGEQ